MVFYNLNLNLGFFKTGILRIRVSELGEMERIDLVDTNKTEDNHLHVFSVSLFVIFSCCVLCNVNYYLHWSL